MRRAVLLVEDDARIRRVVQLILTNEGFQVAEAGTGEDGLELFSRRAFDVVVLDVLLPGQDGFHVCRQIRRTSNVPVIMITARTDSHDVVAGLEAGADDYVKKPFVVKELSARIRALLRRSDDAGPRQPVRIGDIELRPQDGLVLKGERPVDLTRTEFGLLCELGAVPGRVLSREELLERVWGHDYFGDARLVDVHIRRLRTKVEDDPAHPTIVITVRGMGYRLQP